MTSKLLTVCDSCSKQIAVGGPYNAPEGWMYLSHVEVHDQRGLVQLRQYHLCKACWSGAGALALVIEEALHKMVEGKS